MDTFGQRQRIKLRWRMHFELHATPARRFASNVLYWTALAVLFVLAVAVMPARAHDDAQWIMDGRLHNQAGEWCCGAHDCSPAASFIAGPHGYELPGGEGIPYGEAIPLSPDGKLWICRRSDGSRRCVFDKPPGS